MSWFNLYIVMVWNQIQRRDFLRTIPFFCLTVEFTTALRLDKISLSFKIEFCHPDGFGALTRVSGSLNIYAVIVSEVGTKDYYANLYP